MASLVKPDRELYLTLPSNDSSIVSFPNNTNHHWTNQLPHPIELEGEWEVGLSQITLPTESKVKEYLDTLSDDDPIMFTSNAVWVKDIGSGTSARLDITVFYKDIKDANIQTVFDLLKVLFDTDAEKRAWNMERNYVTKHVFRVIYNEVNNDVKITAGHLGTDTATYLHIANNMKVLLRKELCLKFNWVEEKTLSSGHVRPANGVNLLSDFRNPDQGWKNTYRARYSALWNTPFGLEDITDFYGEAYIRFHLEELAYTFTNTINSSYKKGTISRALYAYSSLCAPTITGDQTTDLLRSVRYKPGLNETFTYEPTHIHYKPVRTSNISTIETGIEYLSTLGDDDILLRMRNMLFAPTLQTIFTTHVTYKDIKGVEIITTYDLLDILFRKALQLQAWNMDKDYTIKAAFKVNLDDTSGDVTLSAGHVPTDQVTFNNIANNMQLLLRVDMCEKFGWIKQHSTFDNKPIFINGPNLTSFFRNENQGWSKLYDLRMGSSYKWPYGLEYVKYIDYVNNSKQTNFCRFHLEELDYKFTNTKENTSKKGNTLRSLFVYSSLCQPTITGSNTTDMLREITYKPGLNQTHIFEPRKLTYKPVRISQIYTIETGISESEANSTDYVDFNEGPTILTLHLRKIVK
ncbi:hypothetical protein AWC38_SpisGene23903 [Stylophora pistillata]|uniref:Uncharacterized protein n=1 Tax=Stylophora pistillata TaxID=50429 RepID=A0A2B4R5T6_STYPI|nr:hypothetical protein AWC38_SpisGene23903 [Stylophora pistillata]